MDTLWICIQLKSDALTRYNGDETTAIDAVWDSIITTRKTGKMAGAVIVREIEYWNRFPVPVVMEALRRYITQRCAEKGFNEKYLRGIMRGVAKEKAAPLQKNAGRAGIADQLNQQKAEIQSWLETT